MTIGEQLQAARQAQQLTQQQVATQLHVARQTISNWETARSYPDITSLIALSDLYEVSLDQLLKSDAMLLADLKQKEQTRRTTKATYYPGLFIEFQKSSAIPRFTRDCAALVFHPLGAPIC